MSDANERRARLLLATHEFGGWRVAEDCSLTERVNQRLVTRIEQALDDAEARALERAASAIENMRATSYGDALVRAVNEELGRVAAVIRTLPPTPSEEKKR